jgi:hypothetical protein
MADRKKTQQFIVGWLKKIAPGSVSSELYKKKFEAMSDAEFDTWMKGLENDINHLVIIAPNFSNIGISVTNNLKFAKELGYEFFQRLRIGKQGDIPEHLTPIKYLVIDLPVRRLSQSLSKKMSVPENSKSIDALTGQVNGKSAAASLSFVEMEMLAASGLDKTITELYKYRGGDQRGRNAMNAMISRFGRANQETLQHFAGGVTSTRTLKTFLTAMHLRSTL